MKRFGFLKLLVIPLLFIACGEQTNEGNDGREVTQQFLADYSGSYVERTNRTDDGERIIIERDGDIEIMRIRNIGEANNPAMPEGTTCSYILVGRIRYVTELTNEARQRVDEDDQVYLSPQTHNLVLSVVGGTLTDELLPGSTEDSACQHFINTMNNELPVYSYGMELFGDGVIRFHTTGNDDFEDGERGEGTLDEIFERE